MKKLSIILLGCTSLAATAAPPLAALKDPKLVGLFRQLGDAEGYTYTTSITSTLVTDPKQKDRKTMTNYLSREQFIVYSLSDDNLFILCKKGQFRINHKDKTVRYKKFDNDSLLAVAKEALVRQKAALPLDSFFLTGAMITSRKEAGNKVIYKLSYPANFTMRSMDIVYNKTTFFESISYQFDRPADAGSYRNGNREGVVRQVVVMNGYVHKMPEEIARLLADGKDVFAYIQQKYQGYFFKSL